MNVKEIVKKYLDENGFDGLCGFHCGCEKDDLAPSVSAGIKKEADDDNSQKFFWVSR